MAYSLHVVKPKDFVRLDASGRVDFDASRRVLADLAKACSDRGLSLALLDVRDLYSELSPTDLYGLVKSFHDIGFRPAHRLAVLHRYNSTERAEFFSMCAAEHGFDVRAFDNFEEAIEWLNSIDVDALTHASRDERNVQD